MSTSQGILASPRLRAAALAVLLVAAAWAAYYPALAGKFVWDDDAHIQAVVNYADWNGLWRIWTAPKTTPQYYPLTHTTFWIENRLWGLEHPAGFHAVNIALQCLNALLLWRVLRNLGVGGAWLAAALFALHPVHVESVAWMTERKNVLSMLFGLLSVLCYLRAIGLTATPTERRRWRAYCLAVLFFVLALLSKTAIVPLPGALLLLTWWKTGRLTWRDALFVLPLFALSLAGGAMTFYMEKHHVGAAGLVWQTNLAQRIIIAGQAFWFYAYKLIWPAELSFVYERWSASAAAAWRYAFPATVLGAIAALLLARRRIGRGPLTALLFYAGLLLPALGLANIYYFRYASVADHFQYYASVGPIALAATGAAWLWERSRRWRWAAVAPVCGLLLALLGALTWRQCHVYRDMQTLWLDTLDKNPRAALALNNLAALREMSDNLPEAIRLFTLAIEADPYYPDPQTNLGRLYAENGNVARGMPLLHRAVELDATLPDHFYNRGNGRMMGGDFRNAIADYTEAIRLNPRHSHAWGNRGAAKLNLNDAAGGLVDLDRAIELAPQYPDPHLNRAVAFVMLRDYDRALAAATRAVALAPQRPEGYLKRAFAHVGLRNHAAAWADVRQCQALGGAVPESLLAELRAAAKP